MFVCQVLISYFFKNRNNIFRIENLQPLVQLILILLPFKLAPPLFLGHKEGTS